MKERWDGMNAIAAYVEMDLVFNWNDVGYVLQANLQTNFKACTKDLPNMESVVCKITNFLLTLQPNQLIYPMNTRYS